MSTDLTALNADFQAAIQGAADLKALEVVRVAYLGKKGRVKALMKGMGSLPKEKRASWGQQINALRAQVQKSLDLRRQDLEAARLRAELDAGWLDPTLPSQGLPAGKLHPITRVMAKTIEYFTGLGYSVASGPEIEDAWHNFDALNIPKDHPARDVWDTFYTTASEIPRTHTSSVQIRTLETSEPPLRIIAPGRCFRHETIDATHGAFFNQTEGLYLDRDVTLGNLKATLEGFVEHMFGRSLKTRFRPAFYPFVEPGLDLDIQCIFCNGKGCSICKKTGWIEVIPCGMVHPNVIRATGHDPSIWKGFAFGMGFDRLVMLRYQIDDIRRLYDGQLSLVHGL
jgi:phenylalanyl-tRNA synthetase alpha chain